MKKLLSATAILTAMLWINTMAMAEEVATAPTTEPVATATEPTVATETTVAATAPTDATATTPAVTATTETTTTTTVATTTTTTTATTGNKFASRERLLATLLGSATTGTASGTLSDASGEGQASQQDTVTETGPSEAPVATDTPPEGGGGGTLAGTDTTPTAGGATASSSGDPTTPSIDAERVASFVANLSDEQVLALNRSLNNAVQQKLTLNYDMDLLEKIVSEQYGKQQINALTKALEQEAKFLSLYERTGNEKFQQKAEREKEKFLAKAEGAKRETIRSQNRERVRNTLRLEAKASAGDAAKVAVKEQVRDQARLMAKETAKIEAKNMAKAAAEESVKEMAREAAKDLAKEEAKQLARTSAQDAAKAAAKEAAKETAQEVAKENQRGRGRRNNG